MQSIEFFGPMAVGKSTVYHQCIQNRSSSEDWISSSEAYGLLVSAILKEKSPFKRILGNLAFKFEYLAPLVRGQLAIKQLSTEALTNNAHKWNELLNQYVILQGATDHKDGLLTLRRNRYLLDFLERLALYNQNLPGQKILLDEGICKRTGQVLLHCASNTTTGLTNIPLPNAIICLNASPNTIHARLQNRQKTKPKERRALAIRDMNDSEILDYVTEAVERTDKICGVLENAGLKVLRVNAERPLADQINQVLAFIDTV